jgi:hypothetical protein
MSGPPLRKALARAAARRPRATFAVASGLDWCTAARQRGAPSSRAGAAGLPLPDLELAARASWSSSVRYRVLSSAMGCAGTPWPYWGLVTLSGGPLPRPPAVLATLHIGPMAGLGLLLDRLPGDVLAVTAGLPPRPGMRTAESGHSEWQRMLVFRQALQALTRGGFVFLAVDGAANRRIDVPLLGRRPSIGAGAFALARMTDSPVVPVAARWRNRAIEIVTGAPIPPGEESTMAVVFANWFQHLIESHPEELGPGFVSWLARSPAAAEPPNR